jgi:tetratricopeptide (TPR) repeat protein
MIIRGASLAVLFVLGLNGAAFAVPSDTEDLPPKPTQTSTECPDGKAWDKESNRCIDIKSDLFDDDDRFLAARELAYAGRLAASAQALDAIREQDSSRVLTYRGFLARKVGDWPQAEKYYLAALAADPDSLMTRSYMGMGLFERGDKVGAIDQLREIRSRGGRGGWPERALLMAMRAGGKTSY